MQPMIMVLPGTVWQIALIKRIKEMGYRVLVVHPNADGAAIPFADAMVYADILDKQAVLQAAQKYNVVAVMSDECDIATPTLAYVSEKMGLPTQTETMAELYTDKAKMRDFCKNHDLPYPEYQVCSTIDEAIAFFRKLNKKMIIKPIDANSSRGVFSITSENDLRMVFDDSIAYSHHRHAVVCERYISGAEFSVDGIKLPGGHYCLAISEKKQFSYNQNLDETLYFSYDNPRFDYNRLREINNRFVELSGLPFGFTHAEYKCEDGEFYLLEIGARGGGAMISSHIVPALTGIDNYKYLVDMFVGNPIDKCGFGDALLVYSKVAVLQFFDTTEKGGVVRRILGTDFMNNNPHILHWQLNFKEGDRIQRPTDGGNRIGFYVACDDDRDSMAKLQAEINRNVIIEYE